MTAPSKFAHVVYYTHRYREMIDWYCNVFEAKVQHADDRLTLLTYDDEHHRFAFGNLGPAPDEPPVRKPFGRQPGVSHVAYTWRDLGELVELYTRLKTHDIVPVRPIRHGMTLSMYYADPDGNVNEFQIDLMDADAANDFMASAAFEANPIGELFDPDELVARYHAGRPLADVVFRSDQQPVALPGVRA